MFIDLKGLPLKLPLKIHRLLRNQSAVSRVFREYVKIWRMVAKSTKPDGWAGDDAPRLNLWVGCEQLSWRIMILKAVSGSLTISSLELPCQGNSVCSLSCRSQVCGPRLVGDRLEKLFKRIARRGLGYISRQNTLRYVHGYLTRAWRNDSHTRAMRRIFQSWPNVLCPLPV